MNELEKVVETTEFQYDDAGRVTKSTKTTVISKELGRSKPEQQ